MKKQYKRALSFAGFDGSGGAGIQADLKVFSALGCYGMTVLTANVVQNTQGVQSVYEIPVKCITDQAKAILDDIGVDVVKIGMLHNVEVIEAIESLLKAYGIKTVVIDPVMVAKSGDRLLQPDAVQVLKEKMLPLATVLTPNIPEAEDLLGWEIVGNKAIEAAAKELQGLGPKAVVLKGGHAKEESSIDCLWYKDRAEWYPSERIDTKNTHGTGCTFSAAIAAKLAHGMPILQAIKEAKEYLYGALKSGAEYSIGKGHGPVNHFFDIWN